MFVPCPHCAKNLQNSADLAEQFVICPHCSRKFRMPALVEYREEERPLALFLPEVFEVQSVEQARAIIVVGDVGVTTDERWENETPYLVDDIGRFLEVGPQSCVLDYGCGIGRVAKPLVEKFGCHVVGVDTSRSMRSMATAYVQSERFTVWSPEVLDEQIREGFQADSCFCLWVLQHALDPIDVIDRIARALRPDGRLYAMNQLRRCLPTDRGWLDDGIDVPDSLRRALIEENVHPLPEEVSTARLSSVTLIQVLRKRAVGA